MRERRRRVVAVIMAALTMLAGAMYESYQVPNKTEVDLSVAQQASTPLATEALKQLEEKGRAPKTGYKRALFGNDWGEIKGCDVRNLVLLRDLTEISMADDECKVLSGVLHDPYTASVINFQRGESTSGLVQIDHVVALSDAWQKGAQQFDQQTREIFANDPLNLLAVDGDANQAKSDADSASWLPPNKNYRCRYVARQVAVKAKYRLWVTPAEHDAIQRILFSCPDQRLPTERPAT